MRLFYRTAGSALLFAACGAGIASASTDRVSMGKDIVISDGDTASDVVCIACSVVVQGNVSGDVVSVLGSVRIEDAKHISGDLATVGGDVSLDGGSSVQGSLVVVGGDLDLAPEATVRGDREVFPGRAWLLLPIAPLLIFIGIVWLAIWLIRRNAYRFPMYPYGRGL